MEVRGDVAPDMGSANSVFCFFVATFFFSARVFGFDFVRLCPFLIGALAFIGFAFSLLWPDPELIESVLFFEVSVSNTAFKKSGSPRSCDNCLLRSAAPSRSA